MPQVAANAEDYANARLNIFFPGVVPSLDGQCVSLNKWFLQEMTDVPDPQAARGDARYVGNTLVNQGHATRVPYEQRRRGDFAVFEYGTYGHIGVLLDQDRIFEQNVNVAGVARRLISDSSGSWYVYASRIGRLSESWRPVRATIYRINSYKESNMPDINIVDRGGLEIIWKLALDRVPTDAEYKNFVGKPWPVVLFTAYTSEEYKNRYAGLVKNWDIVTHQVPKLEQRIRDLEAANPATPEMLALYNAVKAVK